MAKHIKRVRSKSINVIVDTEFMEFILRYVTTSMCSMISISSSSEMPALASQRATLEPVYEKVAEILSKYLGEAVKAQELRGMTLDLLPTSGYAKLKVDARFESKNSIQGFTLNLMNGTGRPLMLVHSKTENLKGFLSL